MYVVRNYRVDFLQYRVYFLQYRDALFLKIKIDNMSFFSLVKHFIASITVKYVLNVHKTSLHYSQHNMRRQNPNKFYQYMK